MPGDANELTCVRQSCKFAERDIRDPLGEAAPP